jgi:thioredoxin-like negative regulator of GroEL
MNNKARRAKGDPGYFLRFAGTAMLLVSGTLVMVLFVLPQRYVLSSGFREGSLVFPAPSTPFEPVTAGRIAALPLPPPPPAPPETIVRGPAEVFWATVLPLIEAGRYAEALAQFEQYLASYPRDAGVRLEYARTLVAAGNADRGIEVLEELLAVRDNEEVRLLLARTLRDSGRAEEAAAHYSVLVAADPANETLWLEWAQALAWLERYEAAETVLLNGLDQHPGSIALAVELAEVYYAMGRLEEAAELLAGLTDEELRAFDALVLRADVLRALTPAVDTTPPATPLERAIAARMDGDLDRAEVLFKEVLADNPSDADAWAAYADFLQYERGDLAGALAALKELERLTDGNDPALQYRMAQLEIWTNRPEDARARLQQLLGTLESGPSTSDPGGEVSEPVMRSDVHSSQKTRSTKTPPRVSRLSARRWTGKSRSPRARGSVRSPALWQTPTTSCDSISAANGQASAETGSGTRARGHGWSRVSTLPAPAATSRASSPTWKAHAGGAGARSARACTRASRQSGQAKSTSPWEPRPDS